MVTNFFSRLKTAIQSTKDNLVGRIENLVLGEKKIDASVLDQLEAILIGADIGVATTAQILERAKQQTARDQLNDYAALAALIRSTLLEILNAPPARPAAVPAAPPEVIFVVGVNGVGQDDHHRQAGPPPEPRRRKVVIVRRRHLPRRRHRAAGDLGPAHRHRLVKTGHGSDPAAVLYDALERAQREQADTVIVDTAGRLHTKVNLMKELEKMHRLAAKRVPGAPHEVFLVLDATTGQNGLDQAREFLRTCGVTGMSLTKLDGTANGGVVVAIARELGLPIRYVGVGEKMEDLIDFSAEDFVESLFSKS